MAGSRYRSPNVPEHAEQHLVTDFQSASFTRESMIVPGKMLRTECGIYCPAGCGAILLVEHGEIVKCDCGLWLLSYGNSLNLWRDQDRAFGSPTNRLPVRS